MGKNHFSADQIKALSDNPYVKNVSEKTITYTEQFKTEYIERYHGGELPCTILDSMGFDRKTLGIKRINSIKMRMKIYGDRIEGPKDQREVNSGRPRTKSLSPEEMIARLEQKNQLLEQENEFLKKMKYLVKKSDWEKSKPKKSTKSSTK